MEKDEIQNNLKENQRGESRNFEDEGRRENGAWKTILEG